MTIAITIGNIEFRIFACKQSKQNPIFWFIPSLIYGTRPDIFKEIYLVFLEFHFGVMWLKHAI